MGDAGGQTPDRDTPSQRPRSNPNVFDDEYEIGTPTSSDFDFRVADGLRLPEPSAEPSAEQTTSVGNPERGSTAQAIPKRSSIHKPRMSFGQGNDRHAIPNHIGGVASTSVTGPQRTVSSASSYAPTDRGQSPVPPSQPTHPYALYQQSTSMGRTPSMATESTRPLSTVTSNNLPQRPTHPYGLYSQNGFDEDGESSTPPQPTVPVGFPGRGNDFHRRIGPDGEEQDIIGPDGHTEQLPPYSEYPEAGAAKMTAAVPIPSPTSDPIQPSEITPTSTGSQAQILQNAAEGERGNVSEKTWDEKTWKERRKTKVCGRLPCWMLTFVVVCAVIIVGLIAGLIGGLLSAENKSHDGSVVTTTLFDASEIATPTNVPGPSDGEWALPLGTPEEQMPNCLTDPSQYPAWDCTMYGPPLILNITVGAPGSEFAGTAQIGGINAGDTTWNYGTQPPVMDVSQLEWVVDLDNSSSGPALHFQAYYNKMVVVPEKALFTSSSKHKRRGNTNVPLGSRAITQKGRVEIGDQPWLCYWNSTFLEGFIYMGQDSSCASSQSSAWASWTATSDSSNGASVTAATVPPYMTAGYTTPPGMPPSQVSNYFSSIYASANVKMRRSYSDDDGTDDDDDGQSTDDDDHSHTTDDDDDDDKTTDTHSPSRTTNPSAMTTASDSTPTVMPSVYTIYATDSSTSTGYPVPTSMPLFPHIVKIEERRLVIPDYSNTGACTKMQLLNDGSLVPYEMPGGSTLSVTLSEVDPSAQEMGQDNGDQKKMKRMKKYRRMWDHTILEREVLVERDEPPDSCHCQWTNF